MKNKIKTLFIIGLLAIILTVPAAITFAAPEKKPATPSTIEFMGATPVGPNKVKITYKLTSGDPVLKQWEIFSPCFTRDKIVSVSERYSLNPAQNRLRFTIHYGVGEIRYIEIVLKVDYYSMVLGMLDYKLQWDPYKTEGKIEGPICTPDFIIPENNLGTLGILTSLLAAIGLMATRGKVVYALRARFS